MKKTAFILASCMLLAGFNLSGQQSNLNFFESNGVINQSGELSNDLGYTLTHLDNRADDVVWAHVVYNIIDLRDNINSQLAFPTGQDANYRNLFRLLSEAVVAGTPVYYPNEAGVTPYFDQSNLVPATKLSDVFFIETNVAGAQYIDPLFERDSVNNTLSVSNRIYDRFSKRIHKFLIQQVYYFDKHLSRMSSKIIGIAPLMNMEDALAPAFPNFDDEDAGGADTQQLKTTLRDAIVCWFLYDDLKPHFSTQPVFQESNIAQRISYHEYFSKKMFSAYMIGDNNLMKKLYSNTAELTSNQITEEIKDIQRKLIDIESGIWGR
ncbi:MAG: gliding motility protein GldN [Paludibacter sp.]|nr:gliding motility protein GldN [Paludibacter sp.]MDD4427019.1 gliding motility protein GldN [Paludibacter sp.]